VTNIHRVLFGFWIVSSLFLFTGCSLIDRFYDKQVQEIQPASTRTNTILSTNIVWAPPVTNGITGEITAAATRQVITPEIRIEYTPAVIITNFVVRSSVKTAIGIVESLPIPFGQIGGILLGAVVGGVGLVKSRNSQKKATAKEKVAIGILKSVQAGREILASTPEGKKLGEQFKDTLVREQTYSGIVSEVRDLLNEHLPNHKVL